MPDMTLVGLGGKIKLAQGRRNLHGEEKECAQTKTERYVGRQAGRERDSKSEEKAGRKKGGSS